MQSKARMTFRFEPTKPSQPAKPTRQPTKPEPNPPAENEDAVFKQGFTSWNSPYQDDIHALEEIIRKSDLAEKQPTSIYSADRKIEEPIQAPYSTLKAKADKYGELSEENWSRTSIDDETAGQSPAGWINRSSTMYEGPSWGRVFLSVTAAIATGALFGYMVLGLFTGEPLFPGKTNAGTKLPVQASPGQTVMPSENPTPIPNSSESGESAQSAPQPGDESSLAQVPADVYYMLQYGVFQSEESMQTAVSQLQEMGLASATETDDGYRVYVGAALTRDEAELLAAQMSDIEVYVKPLEGEPLIVSSAVLPPGGAEFLNASAELTRKLAQYTGIGLQDEQPQKMNATEISSLQETHRQWLTTINAADQMNNKAIEDGKTIVLALNSAVLSLTEYNRKPSRFHLWSAQSAVMKALLADRHMRMALQPSADG